MTSFQPQKAVLERHGMQVEKI